MCPPGAKGMKRKKEGKEFFWYEELGNGKQSRREDTGG